MAIARNVLSGSSVHCLSRGGSCYSNSCSPAHQSVMGHTALKTSAESHPIPPPSNMVGKDLLFQVLFLLMEHMVDSKSVVDVKPGDSSVGIGLS